MEILGKVAVVTGGGSGIGRAIALALAGEGAAVAVVDIIEANAKAVVDEIRKAGGNAVAFGCDVCERKSVRAMKSEVNRLLGSVSLLVPNAGVVMFEQLTDMSDDDIDWVIQVSLFGVINCLQAFLPDMISVGEGHVVATASSAALMAPFVGNHAAYVAAKSGVFGLMLSMRCALESSGVGASVLCPGGVESQITNSPRYRPSRFGGACNAEVMVPRGVQKEGRVKFRPAEEVAQMVINGVRENRAVIVTDSSQREKFETGLVYLVSSAFDDVVQFDNTVCFSSMHTAGNITT